MAEGYKSSVIAALRGNGDFSGPRAGLGPSALDFNWGNGAGLNLRRRAAGGALNPARLALTQGSGYAANRRTGGDSSYRTDGTGTLPVATTITRFPKTEEIYTPDISFFEPDMSSMFIQPPAFNPELEQQPNVNISYEELVDPNPWNVKAPQVEVMQKPSDQNVSITYEELVDPNPWNVSAPQPEKKGEITYEELVDPNPWNVQAAQAELTQPEKDVAITYEELVDPDPWNVNAAPAELTQEKDPEVAVTVEEIPDAEPSTLRDTLVQLLNAAPVPVASPVPEPEPEGTVTVEEVPDVPITSGGRTGGGYAIDTGLSREMMMLAALADMFGAADPQGQITIEEIQDLAY